MMKSRDSQASYSGFDCKSSYSGFLSFFDIKTTQSRTVLFESPQKKSREESKGAGSGVEILYNEPYDSDPEAPGTKGQKTVKIYHVGSHLPGWIKSLLPKSALEVLYFNYYFFNHYYFT